jgi:Flp pilus assembly protein TadD
MSMLPWECCRRLSMRTRKRLRGSAQLTAAHNGLAVAYMQMRDYKEAAREFETALKLNPNNRRTRQMLAYCRRMNPETK